MTYLPTDLVTEIASQSSFDQLYLFKLNDTKLKLLLVKYNLALLFQLDDNLCLINELSRILDLLHRYLLVHPYYSFACTDEHTEDYRWSAYIKETFYPNSILYPTDYPYQIKIYRLANQDYHITILRSNCCSYEETVVDEVKRDEFPLYLACMLASYTIRSPNDNSKTSDSDDSITTINVDPISTKIKSFSQKFIRTIPQSSFQQLHIC